MNRHYIYLLNLDLYESFNLHEKSWGGFFFYANNVRNFAFIFNDCDIFKRKF
jgi:hypothetical protein